MCMTLHLLELKHNSHSSDHRLNETKSCCKASKSFTPKILVHILVSSANIRILVLIQSGRSFTNNRNRSGPNTDPCGTPLSTFTHDERLPLMAIATQTAVPIDLYCYADFDYTVIAVCCNALYKTHLIACIECKAAIRK